MNAREKFKIGQEVVMSEDARNHFLPKTVSRNEYGTVTGFGHEAHLVRVRPRDLKTTTTWHMKFWDVVPVEQPAPTTAKSRKNEKRTPEEIALGIPGRCVRAWRAIKSIPMLCWPDTQRIGWVSTDKIVIADKGHADTGRKARLLAELCPNAVRRAYQDRKTGKLYFCEWKDLPGHVDALALYRPAERDRT